MKASQLAAFILASFCFVDAESSAQTGPSDVKQGDRAAIGQTVTAFMNAWNEHDARAFAMTFTPDADFTNVLGVHAQGRASVESFHAPAFVSVFKDSHQTGVIRSIRFLTPELAAVDIDWQMTGAGAKNPDGSPRPVRQGLLNWVMQRQSDGSWLIAIMHNTNLSENPTPAK